MVLHFRNLRCETATRLFFRYTSSFEQQRNTRDGANLLVKRRAVENLEALGQPDGQTALVLVESDKEHIVALFLLQAADVDPP